METPSSTRRVTRSQTSAASANNSNFLLSRKLDESEKTMTKSRAKKNHQKQQDRSALIDITNDSPIVGVAMGNLETPSSAMSKKRLSCGGQFASRTPGSGEALLRGQVKTLLQKVEEEAELSKITLEIRPLFNLVEGFVNSPISLVAPTPANTPEVNDSLPSLTPSTLNEMMRAEMFDAKKEDDIESENVITRSLLLDFSEKSSEPSDSSECSSVVTYQAGEKLVSCTDDDDASIWSIQVNASSTIDDDEEEECEDDCYSYYQQENENEEEEDRDGDNNVDELCEVMSKISVNEEKFAGKHIRFVYNSDDEIEGEEQVSSSSPSSSPSCGVLRLKGLPTPKGTHLRFPTTDDADE